MKQLSTNKVNRGMLAIFTILAPFIGNSTDKIFHINWYI